MALEVAATPCVVDAVLTGGKGNTGAGGVGVWIALSGGTNASTVGVGVTGEDATRVETGSSASLASTKGSLVGVVDSQATNMAAPIITPKPKVKAVFAQSETARGKRITYASFQRETTTSNRGAGIDSLHKPQRRLGASSGPTAQV